MRSSKLECVACLEVNSHPGRRRARPCGKTRSSRRVAARPPRLTCDNRATGSRSKATTCFRLTSPPTLEVSGLSSFLFHIVLAMSEYFGSLQVHSPLESLVRTTSSRRRPNTPQTPLSHDAMDRYSAVPILDAPPKHHAGLPPPSPLLHTRFRASIATQSSSNTYGRARSHVVNQSQDTVYDDDVSVYSAAPANIPNTSNIIHEGIAGSSSRGEVRNSTQRIHPGDIQTLQTDVSNVVQRIARQIRLCTNDQSLRILLLSLL
jgi:hypothetical protein